LLCTNVASHIEANDFTNALRKCAFCMKPFSPSSKCRKHQIYCSISCRNLAKRKRDKHHKRAYQKREKYRLAKREQNRRYRKKQETAEYMRRYREGHMEEIRRQNRKASNKYYQENRRKIAFSRSERRWQKKLKAEIDALKKVSS